MRNDLVEKAKAALKRSELGFDCAECGGRVDHPAEYHSFLFCLLHKQGWSRQLIVSEIRKAYEATKTEPAGQENP